MCGHGAALGGRRRPQGMGGARANGDEMLCGIMPDTERNGYIEGLVALDQHSLQYV